QEPDRGGVAGSPDAHRVGLAAVDPEIDWGRVRAHVHGARERIAPQDSPARLRREGVEVVEAEGWFVAPRRVVAGGRELRFRSAIVATGSAPVVPPVPGLREAEPLTNETVWDLEELPRRLVVLGGGAVGCELGQSFGRLGCAVQ